MPKGKAHRGKPSGRKPAPPRPCGPAPRHSDFTQRLSSRNAELHANLIRKWPARGVGLPVHDGDGWTNESWSGRVCLSFLSSVSQLLCILTPTTPKGAQAARLRQATGKQEAQNSASVLEMKQGLLSLLASFLPFLFFPHTRDKPCTEYAAEEKRKFHQ